MVHECHVQVTIRTGLPSRTLCQKVSPKTQKILCETNISSCKVTTNEDIPLFKFHKPSIPKLDDIFFHHIIMIIMHYLENAVLIPNIVKKKEVPKSQTEKWIKRWMEKKLLFLLWKVVVGNFIPSRDGAQGLPKGGFLNCTWYTIQVKQIHKLILCLYRFTSLHRTQVAGWRHRSLFPEISNC